MHRSTPWSANPRRAFLACAALLLSPLAAWAQPAPAAAPAAGYPDRTVSVLVPYAAGGGTDLLARVLADELGQRLGQKFLVENVAGAGGVVGTRKAMAAPADGYTLLLGSGSELELSQIVDAQADLGRWTPLAPLALIGTQPMVLVGRPSLPMATTDELVAAIKAQPGKLSYASAGFGTQLHLLGELLKLNAGLDVPHIPYKAAGQIAADVIGGHVDLAVMVLPSALPHIRSGKMKAFGLSDSQRSAAAPELPTLNESRAFDNVDMKIWYGLFAPAGTPPAVAARLGQAVAQALRAPAVRSKLAEMAVAVPEDNSAARMTALKAEELGKIKRVFDAIRPAR